ncbi:MAG: phosphate signaling complex protein PhoU [Pirellulales bacterium]|nr:phosphate signaling complex protein PhoU [Pirellulales bacterium]
MTKHLQRDLAQIHREVLSLSARVEDMIDMAARSLRERRHDLADEVSALDNEVDQQEVNIEEECLKILALHQPVAVDLRRVATVLKANNDLERMADLAVNIARRGRDVGDFPEFDIPPRLAPMVTEVKQMVHSALDAFVKLDTNAARKVIESDNEVDRLNMEIINELQDMMIENSHLVVPALHCFSAVRHLERIADLATNLAEDVIYLTQGEIIRHQTKATEMTR